MGNESFDVSCDFSSTTNPDYNHATYCRHEAYDLDDTLFIHCRPNTGAFWDAMLLQLTGFAGPGTYQNTTVYSDPSPQFDLDFSDYDRPTSESLYTSRAGFVGATLNLAVFDLCAGRAVGSIDATWNADEGGILPGVAQVSFDVTF